MNKQGGQENENETVEKCGNLDLYCADDYDGSGQRECITGGGKQRRAESEQRKEKGPGAVQDQGRGCRDGPGHSSC
ncbi:hypothetical protein D3C75_1236210 [compost metagenome]